MAHVEAVAADQRSDTLGVSSSAPLPEPFESSSFPVGELEERATFYLHVFPARHHVLGCR
ncbi:hypothetical protein [Rhodococcus pyridinivorans]|uniref:hypothetical protein n=1 Tax=Rhodococcus pyridinivorans TaxID=103816 RepID=UPI0022848554|nr:hypothetical protein [Rhodococcus pyridinivorans]WAL49339.1 hypothetical protein OQN32_24605 [Rhodococcus pyridinivorans]